MKLYDDSISTIYKALEDMKVTNLDVSDAKAKWDDIGNDNILLRGDMAYELGGGNHLALSSLSITSDETLVPEDEILLYGPELSEISEDISYARLAIVRVKENSLGEGNKLYNAIRKIEYVRYHINPKGYMMRISASNDREPARIGKDALEQGLDFAKVGKLFLDSYHENLNIEAVKLIFVTEPNAPFAELEAMIKKNEQITTAVDHILKNVTMECGSCNLKPICDEVEGMKELHFGATQQEEKGV